MRDNRSTASIVFEAIGAIITLLVVGFLSNLVGGLWLMLALGAAHHQWPVIPAIGYWTSFVLLMGLFAVGGVFRSAKTKTETPK